MIVGAFPEQPEGGGYCETATALDDNYTTDKGSLDECKSGTRADMRIPLPCSIALDTERVLWFNTPRTVVQLFAVVWVTDPVSLADQLRKLVFESFLAWAFLPVLARIVRHGEVKIVFHNGQLRDVEFPLGIRETLACKSPG